MKPSANIRGTMAEKHPPPKNASMASKAMNGIEKNSVQRPSNGSSELGSSDRHLFSTARNTWHRSFPTITMMMQPPRLTGTSNSTTKFRHLSLHHPEVWSLSREGESVVTGIRLDILMLDAEEVKPGKRLI